MTLALDTTAFAIAARHQPLTTFPVSQAVEGACRLHDEIEARLASVADAAGPARTWATEHMRARLEVLEEIILAGYSAIARGETTIDIPTLHDDFDVLAGAFRASSGECVMAFS